MWMLIGIALTLGYLCSTAADRKEARERMRPIGMFCGILTLVIWVSIAWVEWRAS